MFNWLDKPWNRWQTTVDDGGQGGGGGQDDGQGDGGGTADEGQDGGQDDGQGDGQDGGQGDGGKQFDEKYVRELRAEAAKYRVAGKELADQLKTLKSGLAKALGVTEDAKDPEALAKELAALNARYRQERVANEFFRVAQKLGADADLTWAVLQAGGKVKDLDPDDKGFADDLAALVADAVKSNPKLKADYKPAKSGGDFGGGGGNGGLTLDAVQKMTPDEINRNWDKVAKLLERQ